MNPRDTATTCTAAPLHCYCNMGAAVGSLRVELCALEGDAPLDVKSNRRHGHAQQARADLLHLPMRGCVYQAALWHPGGYKQDCGLASMALQALGGMLITGGVDWPAPLQRVLPGEAAGV